MSTQSIAELQTVAVKVSPPVSLPRGRILVTDDEAGIRQSLSMYLKRLGYEVTEAASADDAVAVLDDHEFDLVLSDIALPGTNNGIDLLAKVKQKSPDVDVIMMTGHLDLDFAIDSLKKGASDFFKKPFLFDELKHAVERAIERRRLLGKVRELDKLQLRHEALKELQREVLVSVAAMIDAKSPFTRAHSERVGIYARHFGQKLGVSSRELKIVTTGGRLHDIGKIGTPDLIINKPGRLTAEEWKVVQQHPLCGAELLRPIAMMRPYIPVVRWHHENHDGTGYPDRISGVQIPLTVQIVKMADYYDAITSDRPYRKPMSLREACTTLEGEAGGAFTKEIVTAFIELLHDAPWNATEDESVAAKESDEQGAPVEPS
jgi:putative two-component system response regulator